MSVYCDWVRKKLNLQLLSQCGSTYNCLGRAVPERHCRVAGTLNNQQTVTACPGMFPRTPVSGRVALFRAVFSTYLCVGVSPHSREFSSSMSESVALLQVVFPQSTDVWACRLHPKQRFSLCLSVGRVTLSLVVFTRLPMCGRVAPLQVVTFAGSSEAVSDVGAGAAAGMTSKRRGRVGARSITCASAQSARDGAAGPLAPLRPAAGHCVQIDLNDQRTT